MDLSIKRKACYINAGGRYVSTLTGLTVRQFFDIAAINQYIGKIKEYYEKKHYFGQQQRFSLDDSYIVGSLSYFDTRFTVTALSDKKSTISIDDVKRFSLVELSKLFCEDHNMDFDIPDLDFKTPNNLDILNGNELLEIEIKSFFVLSFLNDLYRAFRIYYDAHIQTNSEYYSLFNKNMDLIIQINSLYKLYFPRESIPIFDGALSEFLAQIQLKAPINKILYLTYADIVVYDVYCSESELVRRWRRGEDSAKPKLRILLDNVLERLHDSDFSDEILVCLFYSLMPYVGTYYDSYAQRKCLEKYDPVMSYISQTKYASTIVSEHDGRKSIFLHAGNLSYGLFCTLSNNANTRYVCENRTIGIDQACCYPLGFKYCDVNFNNICADILLSKYRYGHRWLNYYSELFLLADPFLSHRDLCNRPSFIFKSQNIDHASLYLARDWRVFSLIKSLLKWDIEIFERILTDLESGELGKAGIGKNAVSEDFIELYGAISGTISEVNLPHGLSNYIEEPFDGANINGGA